MDDTSTLLRIGSEPLSLLNSSWAAGASMVVASSFCARTASGLAVFGNTKASPCIRYGTCWPEAGDAAEVLAGALAPAANSPLAQSPMICTPALPLISMAVASFQLRLGEPAST
jgi:hypothetical protein